jgi:hypothetical protein
VAEAEGEVKNDIAVEVRALRQIWTLKAYIACRQLLRHRQENGAKAEAEKGQLIGQRSRTSETVAMNTPKTLLNVQRVGNDTREGDRNANSCVTTIQM